MSAGAPHVGPRVSESDPRVCDTGGWLKSHRVQLFLSRCDHLRDSARSGTVLHWAALHDALLQRTATSPKGLVAPTEYIRKAATGVTPEVASPYGTRELFMVART